MMQQYEVIEFNEFNKLKNISRASLIQRTGVRVYLIHSWLAHLLCCLRFSIPFILAGSMCKYRMNI